MSGKFLCVIASYDDATEEHFSQIQQKLYDNGYVGRHTKNIPQHITLGTFPVEMENEILKKVEMVAKATRSFAVTFNHVGIFQGSQVLFLAPDTSLELLKLKENFGDSFGWTAHTTMLIDDADRIMRAVPIVLDHFSAYVGKVKKLHLYEFFPTRHILSVELKES